jgi:hypothetical protein
VPRVRHDIAVSDFARVDNRYIKRFRDPGTGPLRKAWLDLRYIKAIREPCRLVGRISRLESLILPSPRFPPPRHGLRRHRSNSADTSTLDNRVRADGNGAGFAISSTLRNDGTARMANRNFFATLLIPN